MLELTKCVCCDSAGQRVGKLNNGWCRFIEKKVWIDAKIKVRLRELW